MQIFFKQIGIFAHKSKNISHTKLLHNSIYYLSISILILDIKSVSFCKAAVNAVPELFIMYLKSTRQYYR